MEQSAGVEGRVWSRIVRSVTRTPVWRPCSAGLLVVAALPVLRMETGLTGVRELPGRFAAKQGFTLLEEEFGIGTADSVQVVVEGDIEAVGSSRRSRDRGPRRRRRCVPAAEVSTSPDGRLANVEALVAGDSRDERALKRCSACAPEVVPEVFAGVDAGLVGGETAEVVDTPRADGHLAADRLRVRARAQLRAPHHRVPCGRAPAVAIGLNLLSVGAAYGLIVLVFLEGVGRDLLGFTEVDVIAAWLPLFLFAVLFGLSMDYTVFLLGGSGSTSRAASRRWRPSPTASPRRRGSSPAPR